MCKNIEKIAKVQLINLLIIIFFTYDFKILKNNNNFAIPSLNQQGALQPLT